MDKIDFLPKWYKAGRRRKVNYRRQYMILGGIVLAMLAWSFAASYSVSVVQGQVQMMQQTLDSHRNVAQKYHDFQEELTELSRKAALIDKLKPRIRMSVIMAELSHLITDNVIVTKLTIDTEPYEDKTRQENKSVIAAVKKAQEQKQQVMPEENTRLKVIVTGLAKGTADVAEIISNLEQSEYFTQIIPGFSRNSKLSGKVNATEFEITCYVANYKIEGHGK